MDYLKLFQNHEDYEDFVSGDTMVKPNISHCIQENEVHYNPWTDPRLIVKYVPLVSYQLIGEDEAGHQTLISNISPTQLYFYLSSEKGVIINGAAMFDKVEIDGVEVSITDLDASGGTYQFATEGEHTVKYTLKDPTSVVEGAFYNCSGLTSVTIPNSVTSIGNEAFADCSSLASVTIGNSVTRIERYAFCACPLDSTSMTAITNINTEATNCPSPIGVLQ